ncbi:UNVERIFIED_CONTAM: hypothetical protein FKN15_001854 [Acipenser sinensis]
MHNQAQFLWAEQSPKARLSATRREGKPTHPHPHLCVIAMTDRWILRDCCPLPAEPRIRQIVSTDLPCYSPICMFSMICSTSKDKMQS